MSKPTVEQIARGLQIAGVLAYVAGYLIRKPERVNPYGSYSSIFRWL